MQVGMRAFNVDQLSFECRQLVGEHLDLIPKCIHVFFLALSRWISGNRAERPLGWNSNGRYATTLKKLLGWRSLSRLALTAGWSAGCLFRDNAKDQKLACANSKSSA